MLRAPDRIVAELQSLIENLEEAQDRAEALLGTQEIWNNSVKIRRKISGAISSISKATVYISDACNLYRIRG